MNAMVTTPMPPPKHPQNSEEGGGDCYVNVTTYVSARKPPTPVAYLAAAPSVPSSMVSFGKARTVKMRATRVISTYCQLSGQTPNALDLSSLSSSNAIHSCTSIHAAQ